MKSDELHAVAKSLVAPGKGILAADESLPTIAKRFKSIGVESTEETRRDYRQMLFTTEGLGEFISGVILFDETLRQKAIDGTPFTELLVEQRMLPGIKVDQGTKGMSISPKEKITEGLVGLDKRLADYAKMGARFTKWRAVITIGNGIPTRTCLECNAQALARFAILSQEAGLVPVVEPEVLMDGSHTIERHLAVTEETLELVFHALHEHNVRLEGMLLKPNMVLSGKECAEQTDVKRVAEMTLQCLKRTVPAAVPGIVFLSGGQNDVLATEHLNEMNVLDDVPWQLSFSFGRALQDPALTTWRGSHHAVHAAQRALLHRARCNSAARHGVYTKELEDEFTGELHEAKAFNLAPFM